MNNSEFDKFADEYYEMLGQNIKTSGENPEFFSEYKIVDAAAVAQRRNFASNLKILDFGSGIGNSVPYFRKHFPSSDLTCVDVSERSLEIASQRFPEKADYRLFDGKTLPFADNTFDLVFTACVFHHIPADLHVDLLQEIRRVTKPRGVFMIFEHNPLNPLTVRAVNTCPFDENAVLMRSGTLKKRLESAGFTRPEVAFRIFFPNSLKKLRFLERSLRHVPLGAQYSICAGKEE